MKLGILHLSDLHFRDTTNVLSDKTTEVIAAFQSADPLVEACIILVTGDLAFSGKSSEYGQALQFPEGLQKQLDGTERPRCLGICMVPGNHDCDFTQDTPVRQLVLEAFSSGSKELKGRDEMARALLTVQSAFFIVEGYFAPSPTSTLGGMRCCVCNRLRFHSVTMERGRAKFSPVS